MGLLLLVFGLLIITGKVLYNLNQTRIVAPNLRIPRLLIPRWFLAAFGALPLSLKQSISRKLRPYHRFEKIKATELEITNSDNASNVRVLLYERRNRKSNSPAILWMHGGGYVSGTPELAANIAIPLINNIDCLFISVDYRLAPDYPFPSALNDCYTALLWLFNNPTITGINYNKIVIGGDSAGGGLCAALAQKAFDDGIVKPILQILLYPMLDDRTGLKEKTNGRGQWIWTPTDNYAAWKAYLKNIKSANESIPYAVPARRQNLSGLPPAWIGVGNLDLFYKENITYAERLRAAGVTCQLEIIEGAYHAFDMLAPNAPETRLFYKKVVNTLEHYLKEEN